MDKVTDRAWLKDRAKYPTGFCNEYGKPGQHEGHKPKTLSGKPMPTCEFFDTCPCKCHKDIDELFEMTNRDRVLITNPEYQPEKAGFVMPVVGMDHTPDVALSPAGAMTPPNGEDTPAAPAQPAVAPLATRRTDTGRAARGGLEAQVWHACSEMLNAGLDTITPKIVGTWIASKYVIPTPSSGAINAVWDRWEKMGYATQAKKPVRLVAFTQTGTWEELQRMKSSQRTLKKSAKAETARNFRR